jgi:hypothetical protein
LVRHSQVAAAFAVGTVWCEHMAGSFAMVDIRLDREGQLVTRTRMNMR